MDFVADEVAKTLLVELHPDLHVNSVKSGNQTLTFERDNNSPLLLSVGLAGASTPGHQSNAHLRLQRPDLERGGQPDARRAVCLGG